MGPKTALQNFIYTYLVDSEKYLVGYFQSVRILGPLLDSVIL